MRKLIGFAVTCRGLSAVLAFSSETRTDDPRSLVQRLSRNSAIRDPLDELAGVIGDIPRHRIDDNLSAGVQLEAGIVCGLVYRLGGFRPAQEVAAPNDATIYMHARERGYTVLTRNIRDFDLMNQIVPSGRVLFYRTV